MSENKKLKIISIVIVAVILSIAITGGILFSIYFVPGMPDSQGMVSNIVTVDINGENVTLLDYVAWEYSTPDVYLLYPAVDIKLGDSIAVYSTNESVTIYVNKKESYKTKHYELVGICGISVEKGWNYIYLMPQIVKIVTEWQNDLSY